ncbi:leucine-rich repeat receptor protein kinase EMS1-like, partial [Olea europaea var. sylvestris]|uniref:leucine-rich repeat receptor protein kinase EMS1-like n=1 Tax=Olea europaea var. sylvestris TaxID=158386 RepID=UPI000C1D1E8F
NNELLMKNHGLRPTDFVPLPEANGTALLEANAISRQGRGRGREQYGQSWKSTTRGDVYSFGVILLELLTGKEPTGPDFKDIEGGNLVGWVFQKIKNCQTVDVLDLSILDADSKQAMLQTLQIAVLCLSENPTNRPTMLNVLKFLKGIKDE